MRILRCLTISFAAAVLIFSAASCESVEKVKESTEIEAELEKKYSREFEFISTEEVRGNYDMKFRDKSGIEFTVMCRNSSGLMPSVKWEYSDDYVVKYIEKNEKSYLSGLKEAGIEISFNAKAKNSAEYEYELEQNVVRCDIRKWSQIDVLFEETEKLDPPIKSDSYISTSPSPLAYCIEGYLLGDSGYSEESIRENYAELVEKGKIDEKLPEEVLGEYNK